MPSFQPGTLHKYSFPVQNIVVAADTITQVSSGNARRIALGIYSQDKTMVIYPMSTGVQMSQMSPMLSNTGGLWFLASEVGPLCQLDWYCWTTAGGIITVLEVVEVT